MVQALARKAEAGDRLDRAAADHADAHARRDLLDAAGAARRGAPKDSNSPMALTISAPSSPVMMVA
ncbi:hypothetical protein [Mesorhizobium sp. M1E.F.Ca.ET.041.01.1.1]|uniref:hypothetical protein n=1 Tax=Mesorhizobium sp. M1E.F.Ca.ET.041.01.1.1 TaxID=2496759 RepID=UPI00167710FB|nr:hypothetical protein [Mesorhizobium sp. M1E.F.Ca.ET.041.01.1.1]